MGPSENPEFDKHGLYEKCVLAGVPNLHYQAYLPGDKNFPTEIVGSKPNVSGVIIGTSGNSTIFPPFVPEGQKAKIFPAKDSDIYLIKYYRDHIDDSHLNVDYALCFKDESGQAWVQSKELVHKNEHTQDYLNGTDLGPLVNYFGFPSASTGPLSQLSGDLPFHKAGPKG